MCRIKRILSLLLCCALVLACVVASSGSAVAAEDEDLYRSINVLDYTTPNNSGVSRAYLSNTSFAKFELPFSYGLVYFDLVLEFYSAPSSVFIYSSSNNKYPLNVHLLEGRIYRCYGYSSLNVNSLSFSVGASFSDNSDVLVLFQKFDAYTFRDPAVDEYGEMRVTPAITQDYAWQTMNMPGSTLGMNLYNWARDGYQEFEAEFSSVNWRKFDYLDFKIKLNVSTIDSIICQIRSSNSSISVPFEISWVTGTAMSNNQFIAHGEMASQMGQLNASSTFLVNMRLFIPQYARDSGSLIITFNGKYPSSGNAYYVSLQTVTGYYTVDVPDPELVKLDQITAAIEKSLSSSAEDNATAGAFQESMQEQTQSMSANQQILNNVEKPDAAQLGSDFSAGAILDDSGMTLLTRMLHPITDSSIYLGVLTLVGTLALVSYVFFGKKK